MNNVQSTDVFHLPTQLSLQKGPKSHEQEICINCNMNAAPSATSKFRYSTSTCMLIFHKVTIS